MNRREFITLIGGAAVAWPPAARAQQPAMPVVGFLHPGSRGAFGHVVEGFRRGLVESDLVEGRNAAVEYRWAENQLGRLPTLAADLVRRGPAVIVAGGGSIEAAKTEVSTTPIVFLVTDDPVKLGLVQSLNRPGGQMTGIIYSPASWRQNGWGCCATWCPPPKQSACLSSRVIGTLTSRWRGSRRQRHVFVWN